MAATSNTHNKDESLALVAPVFTISARLFQVEKKLTKMAITSTEPNGSPNDN